MSSQAYNSYPRWKQYQTSRTAASLIVHSSSPTIQNKPKLRIDDLFNKKSHQSNQKDNVESPKKQFFKHAPLSQVNKSPRERNFQIRTDYVMELEKLKKNQVGSPKNSAIASRFEKRQGGLTNCKSQKNLPSFLRSNSRSPQKLKPKLQCKERFKIIKKLGEGRFGAVYLARDIETHFTVALKVMNKHRIIQGNLLNQLIRQIKIQTFLEHPNIIKCYGFFSDAENLYALLELGCDGQLYDIMSTGTILSEESTSFITSNLLDAISLMHKHKILHRDIKPQNVVVTHGNVKLCDFGWAVNKKQELRSTFCGTPLYLSPQILKGQKYDEKVDLWAIGIMAYELHLGRSPFQINQQQDLQKIVTDQINFPKKVSKQFKQFINHILNKNPRQRLNCQQLLKLGFIKKYQQLQSCQELCQ